MKKRYSQPIPHQKKRFDVPLHDDNTAIIVLDKYPLSKGDVVLILEWLKMFGDVLIKNMDIIPTEGQMIDKELDEGATVGGTL